MYLGHARAHDNARLAIRWFDCQRVFSFPTRSAEAAKRSKADLFTNQWFDVGGRAYSKSVFGSRSADLVGKTL